MRQHLKSHLKSHVQANKDHLQAKMSSKLTSRMGKLNPFKKGRDVDDEDQGEEVDDTSVAGGGHSLQAEDARRCELRLSDAAREFLVKEGVVAEGDETGLRAFIQKTHISVPEWVTDPNHALPEYVLCYFCRFR